MDDDGGDEEGVGGWEGEGEGQGLMEERYG